MEFDTNDILRFDPRSGALARLRSEYNPDQERDDSGKWTDGGGGGGGGKEKDGGNKRKSREAPEHKSLPVKPLPSPKMPAEGRAAYSQFQSEQFAKLEPREMAAIAGFTNGYDWAIREIDKGKSDEEILKGIEDHRAQTPDKEHEQTPEEHLERAKEMREDLYSAMSKMDRVTERDVYRGLRDLDQSTFDAIRSSEHVDIGAVSSTSWNPQVAVNFADLDIPTPGKYQVIFKLTTRSGYAVEDASDFQGEREILVPKGTRFKVTNVFRPEGAAEDSAVVIEAREVDGDGDGRTGAAEEADDEQEEGKGPRGSWRRQSPKAVRGKERQGRQEDRHRHAVDILRFDPSSGLIQRLAPRKSTAKDRDGDCRTGEAEEDDDDA